MQDLISRQAAIDAIEHRLAEPAYQHTGEGWYVGMNCAESELYDLPSAQPEIIRCKDCKHYNGEDRDICCPLADYAQSKCGADWFCADGEQKEALDMAIKALRKETDHEK